MNVIAAAPTFETKRKTSLTPEQLWHRAALRALAADLPHRLRLRGGSIVVPSQSDDTVRHHVQLVDGRVGVCDCTASLGGNPICAHRASAILRLAEREYGLRITNVKPAAIASLVAKYAR